MIDKLAYLSMNEVEQSEFNVKFPKDVVEDIDKYKGFYSRNRWLLYAAMKLLDEQKKQTPDDLILINKRYNNRNVKEVSDKNT